MTAKLYYGLFSLIVVGLILCPSAVAQQTDRTHNAITPRIFFDHLFIVVDEDTYRTIHESDFIRDIFCMYAEDTISNENETWAGAYIHGENTYIEIFKPSGIKGAKEGAIGLAFLTTRAGDIDIVCERYKNSLGEGLEVELTHFVGDTVKFPWFYALKSDSSDENPVSAWVMEYHPMHLQFMGITPDSDGFISRETFMKAMNSMVAGQTDQPLEPILFRNITAISLVMTQSELDRFSIELAAIFYTKKVENNITSFYGPGMAISCTVKSNPKYRVQSLDISLSRKPENDMVLQLGANSKLTISKDGTGCWTFTDGP